MLLSNYSFLVCHAEYCPPGWTGTKTVCLTMVMNETQNINYAEAVELCAAQDPVAYPMEPYNDYLYGELQSALSNDTSSETSFWIGIYIYIDIYIYIYIYI